MANRLKKLSFVAACLALCSCGRTEQPAAQPPAAAPQPVAQPPATPLAGAPAWQQRLPQKNPDEFTFDDFKNAFEAQARSSPAPREDVTPVGAEGPQDPARKRAAEEENLYRRWEWFTEPRVYPTGRWDTEKVLAELSRVAAVDNDLDSRGPPRRRSSLHNGPPSVRSTPSGELTSGELTRSHLRPPTPKPFTSAPRMAGSGGAPTAARPGRR